jgi:plastocyanin
VEPFQATMPMMEGTRITIQDSVFEPGEVTVPVGTTVIWEHEGSFNHTVTADDGTFDSGTLTNGDTFTFTFEEAGAYPFHCIFHGAPDGVGMSGVITVTEQ